MAKKESRDVVQHEDGWAVRKPGASRASSVHDTQQAAIDAARNSLQREGGGELRIHGRDGQIRDANTIPPANDPYPPKG